MMRRTQKSATPNRFALPIPLCSVRTSPHAPHDVLLVEGDPGHARGLSDKRNGNILL